MATTKVGRRRTRDAPVHPMVQTQEMHCVGCGRFLAYQAIVWGVVQIKCPNCKEWNTIDVRPER